jgi:hypothetical protein
MEKFIAHRGNLNGIMESLENEPTYIDLAIEKGYDVEVDIWYIDGLLYLGHDKPQYCIDFRWIHDRFNQLWIHCKNIESVLYLQDCGYNLNYFWHENDKITLTSLGYIWAYPTEIGVKNSIAVMPEIHNTDISKCLGICSDYIENYKNDIINLRN